MNPYESPHDDSSEKEPLKEPDRTTLMFITALVLTAGVLIAVEVARWFGVIEGARW